MPAGEMDPASRSGLHVAGRKTLDKCWVKDWPEPFLIIQEDTYFRVLRMLQDNPDLTQRDIAERLGVSTSGMNYCLNALIDKGWVKVQNFSQSKNKFGYIYVLTPQGIVEKVTLTSRFLKRKQAEYEALRAEIDGLNQELDNSRTKADFKST